VQRRRAKHPPADPYAAWAVAFVLVFTGLNLRGVQSSSRVNTLLALGMSIVVVIFIAYAIRYIALVAKPVGGQWLLPFYDPATFAPGRIFHGTSIAVLTYIGFDGISTMSEEVENPRRNILLATVLTCFVIGILSADRSLSSATSLARPHTVPRQSMVDTAFVEVAHRVGGKFLFALLNATLLIANMGSGIAAQFGAARLLYGMGRANALPKRFFGAISPTTHIPRNNVLLSVPSPCSAPSS
jgi:putrescine importer